MTVARPLEVVPDDAAPGFDHDTALAFLRGVFGGLPGFVQVCAAGDWRGEFFPTDDGGLAAAAVHAMLLDSGRPQGVYARATTLVERPPAPRRGSAEDTATVPVLWGDVDYGTEGHKGAGNPPTQAAAERVIAECGMPAPTIVVHSGGGLYPLWRLREAPTLAEAAELSERVQRALQRAAERHGWVYGTGVGDLARVLRLPGSVNRKTDQARPCQVIGGSGQPIDAGDVPADPEPAPGPASTGTPGPLPAQRPYDPDRATGPLDVLAEHTAWGNLLVPAGWTYVRSERDGAELWRRPGDPSSEYSARCFPHNMVVHSESAGLPAGAGQRITKGRLFAHLNYAGDVAEAARDLVRAAHGSAAGPAARALPAGALDAVRAAHDAHDPWARLVEGGTAALTARLGDPSSVPLATVPPPA
ncbi:MAG: hypothetical protein L0I76_18645, partial [Pseudonocardia sp.]|nr:hypothetical protein [Pseudonocardia sp.]